MGAGPGGLQTGYFLERAGRDYIIFEKDGVAGSFFTQYPRHRKIISINKRHTGKTNKEFNMRHDWNSLISDDESLLMKHYSKEFFPHADDLVKYLKDYARKLKLKIQYNTHVKNVAKFKKPGEKQWLFELRDQNDTEYTCKYLIMSTGIWVENIPKHFRGQEHTQRYSQISTNPDDYEGQNVLIVGRGNSAFETADSIMGATNFIHMFSRSRIRLSWETHYVGDLRAINNGVLDTYQLKSLDALLEAPIEQLGIIKKDGKLWVDAEDGSGDNVVHNGIPNENMPDNFAVREPYDRIILCLGFKFDFSIFDNSTKPDAAAGKRAKKYPAITPSYQSSTVPHLYFSGTNTHSVDFRKSAGGFIHGFRYTARALHHIMEYKHHGVEWPHVKLPITELLNTIIKRINEASGFYQMFSVLGDVIVFRDDGYFEYFEEFPIKLVHRITRYTGRPAGPMIVLNMEYGKGFSGPGKDIFRSDRATGEPGDAHTSNFLHPVFYFYSEPPLELSRGGELPRPDRIHHVVEDFLTSWVGHTSHILPLRRFIEYVTDSDLREYFAQSCFKMLMTHSSVPRSCRHHYLSGPMLPGSEDLLTVARSGSLMM